MKKGWQTKTLGDVCHSFRTGHRPDDSGPSSWSNVPLVTLKREFSRYATTSALLVRLGELLLDEAVVIGDVYFIEARLSFGR